MHKIIKKVTEIKKLDHQGRGISKNSNEIMFIENALIDEEVIVEIKKQKKNIVEAEVIEILKMSSNRENPICPYYNLCGGCNIMHMNESYQAEFKQNKVKEILKKFGNIEKEVENIITDTSLNYRNKATFQVKEKIGYYQKNSYEIVEINKCLIVNDKINKILKVITEKINLNNCYQIIIRCSQNTEDSMVIFKTNSTLNEQNIIVDLSYLVTSIIIYNKDYRKIYGQDFITEILGKYKYIISPDSFFQVNTKQAEQLYNTVLKCADLKKQDNVLDLYCGTGTIGIYVSEYCNKVLGIEINKYAVKDALTNKQINNVKNIEFICENTSNINNLINELYNIVIIDPPRNGLDKETIKFLKNNKFDKVIYVSCDPVTLARDLKELDNYDVSLITLVDMFKETSHVECVSLLVRKTLEK